MSYYNWLLELREQDILTESEFQNENVLHLKTPCQVVLSEDANKTLQDNYDPNFEKGGVLVAYPSIVDGNTVLTISEIVYLTNVTENPERQYRPDDQEYKMVLQRAANDSFLPIRFHTHPTTGENPMSEMFNYIFQSNTSKQDQLVSNNPLRVKGKKLLLPRSLMLSSGKSKRQMFIGFYNGLIAPIEFSSHREEEIENAMDDLMTKVGEWADEGNNGWILAGGALVVSVLIYKYPKIIPILGLLIAMAPMFVNGEHKENPKYFAQLSESKTTTILFP